MDPALVDTIRSVISRHSAVMLAYLYGSQATGNVGPLSDVDVAVYLNLDDPRQRFELRLRLMTELCDALSRPDVEVAVLNDTARPAFKYHVIADGQLLYEVEPFRLMVERRILDEYFDFTISLERHGLAGVRV